MITRILAIALSVAVFTSALDLIVVRHENRKLFVELQELETARDLMLEEWGRLQLEEATWGTHGRVEEFAREKLGMTQPELNAVVLVMP